MNHYALVRHCRDKVPQLEACPDFDAFCERVGRHEVRESKDGPAFIPVLFSTAYATDDNVLEVHALVLDFDRGLSDEALSAIEGFDALLYSTHRHMETPEVAKYRLVVALSRPVKHSEWRSFWERALLVFPGADADPACCNESRIYYRPSCPPSRAAVAVWERLRGAPLDVDGVLALELPAGAVRAPERRKRQKQIAAPLRPLTDADREVARSHVRERAEAIAAQPYPGPIYTVLNGAAFGCGRFVPHVLSRDEVIETLLAAAQRRNPDPEYREKYERIISTAVDDQPEPWLPDEQREQAILSSDSHSNIALFHEAIGRNAHVFVRGTSLVRVLRNPPLPVSFAFTEPSLRIQALDDTMVIGELSRTTIWHVRTQNGGTKPARVNATDVGIFARLGTYPTARKLSDVVQTPVLRADGAIISQPGYDAESGILFAPEVTYPDIPERPSAQDVTDALALLFDAVADFPFESDHHKAAWLAALLTPLARNTFRGPTPVFLIDSPTPGTGKNLLAEVSSLISTGAPASTGVFMRNEDEMEKRITMWVRDGERVVCLDEVTELSGKAIQSAVTSDEWTGRLLGRTEKVTAPMTITWFATGNNVDVIGDMARRFVPIRLVSPEANPEERQDFRHKNLKQYVRAERPALLKAALTLLRSFFAAGCPKQPEQRVLGSYEGWCSVVCAAVMHAGLPDPLLTRATRAETLRSEGEEQRRALVHGFAEIAGETGIYAKDITEKWQAHYAQTAFGRAVRDELDLRAFEAPSAKKVGKMLRRLSQRNVGGIFIEGIESKDAIRWRARKVGG